MARARKRKIVITYGSDSKVYDGFPLNCNEYTLSGDEIDSLDTLNVTVCSSQTLVGESNVHACELEGPTITGTSGIEYEIEEIYGTVTVTDGTGEDEEPVDDGLVVTVSADIDWPYDLGDEVTFNITATNIYDENRTIVLSEIEGVTLAQSVFENVEPGETVETTATCTITQADVASGHFTNTVWCEIGEGFVKTAQCTIQTGEAFTSLNVDVATTSTPANMESYVLGETISYQFTITNDGNTTVANISAYATIDNHGDVTLSLSKSTLVPDESVIGTVTHDVTEEDILAGYTRITITASGEDLEYNSIENSDDVDDPVEDIDATLTCNIKITNEPANGTAYQLGETIEYDIDVTNEGNVYYNNVVVESLYTGIEQFIGTLAAGETRTFTISDIVDEDEILSGYVEVDARAYADSIEDPKTNDELTPEGNDTATTGDEDDPDGPTYPIEDPNPEVTITQTRITIDNHGQYIGYEITNTGNLTLNSVELEEYIDNDWVGSHTLSSFAEGESRSFDDLYIDDPTISHTLTIEASVTYGNNGTSTDTLTATIEAINPHLSATVRETSTPDNETGYALGETIEYAIDVENDGNTALSNIDVACNLTGDEWNPSLSPGSTITFITSYVVTEMDIIHGSVTADLEVSDPISNSGEYDIETDISITQCTVQTDEPRAAMSIAVSTTSTPANGEYYTLNEAIQYKFTVTNTGNLTLTSIAVGSNYAGTEWSLVSLPPYIPYYDDGQNRHIKEYTDPYYVKPIDVSNGQVVCDGWARCTKSYSDTTETVSASANGNPILVG